MVSVIITTYNSENSIIECLTSIENQNESIEVLIYDDKSTDRTTELINEYFEQNSTFTNKFLEVGDKNFGGPARGRNWGIEKAEGDFIAFLDADDYWLANKLKSQLQYLQDNPSVAFCGTAVRPSKLFKSFIIGKISLTQQIIRNRFILSSLIFRAEIIKSYTFSEDKELISVEDYDLSLRLINEDYRGDNIGIPLTHYTINENSISHKNIKENELRRIKVIKNLKTNLFHSLLKFFVSSIYRAWLILK